MPILILWDPEAAATEGKSQTCHGLRGELIQHISLSWSYLSPAGPTLFYGCGPIRSVFQDYLNSLEGKCLWLSPNQIQEIFFYIRIETN